MNIICLKWGDKFSHEHVNRLYKMVCKNYKDDLYYEDHKFIEEIMKQTDVEYYLECGS